MTRTSTQRPLSPQPAHAGAAANASNSAINVHEHYTRTHTTDNGEPPVREKLKKTSITAESQTPGSSSVTEMCVPSAATASTTIITNPDVKSTEDISDEERGRLSRKRSFDDTEVEEQEYQLSEKPTGGEKKDNRARKRSRDSKNDPSDDEHGHKKDTSQSPLSEENASGPLEIAKGDPDKSLAKSESCDTNERDGQSSTETNEDTHFHKDNIPSPESIKAESDHKTTSKEKHITPPLDEGNKREDDLRETVGSPKNKRTRDEFTNDEETSHEDKGAIDSKDDSIDVNKVKNGDEPRSKRHRDSSSPQPEDVAEENLPNPTTTVSSWLIVFINLYTNWLC